MTERPVARIAVLGAGSWGTALSLQLLRVGHQVNLWTHSPAQAQAMIESGRNAAYLPDVELPKSLQIFTDLEACVGNADHLLIVTPSHAFAQTLEKIQSKVSPQTGVAWACKGFEPGTGQFLHQVAASLLPESVPMALVSGPSFANEVALGLPTAVTVASNAPEFGARWASLLHGESFRAYYTADLVGAELGGALKNVIAVACGLADGLGLGQNTRAALITRGLAEMIRLGEAIEADPRTLIGLAGMGDLVLTCTGDSSRNRRFGLALGAGQSVNEALESIGQTVEGVNSAREAMRLARRFDVDMPITEQVWGIIFEGWSPSKGVRVLMERDPKKESD